MTKSMETQRAIDEALNKIIDATEGFVVRIFGSLRRRILDALASLFRKYKEPNVPMLDSVRKYNRLGSFISKVSGWIADAYKSLFKRVSGDIQDIYENNHLRSGHLFEFAAQKRLGFKRLKAKDIQKAVENPIPELEAEKQYNKQRDETAYQIAIEVRQGLQAGEGYEEIAKRIEKRTGMAEYRAKRTARTEAHRVQNQARLDAGMQASKRTKMVKMWDGTLDRRTRPAHRKLDGTKIAPEKLFVSTAGGVGPAPGLMMNPADDCNCRCAVVFLVNGELPKLRRARPGKDTEVIPYQTFEEWKEALAG